MVTENLLLSEAVGNFRKHEPGWRMIESYQWLSVFVVRGCGQVWITGMLSMLDHILRGI